MRNTFSSYSVSFGYDFDFPVFLFTVMEHSSAFPAQHVVYNGRGPENGVVPQPQLNPGDEVRGCYPPQHPRQSWSGKAGCHRSLQRGLRFRAHAGSQVVGFSVPSSRSRNCETYSMLSTEIGTFFRAERSLASLSRFLMLRPLIALNRALSTSASISTSFNWTLYWVASTFQIEMARCRSGMS